MIQVFNLFVFQRLSPQSHVHIGDLRPTADALSTGTLELLTEAVRGYVKSCQKFKAWGDDVDGIDFVAHKVRQSSFLQLSLERLSVISRGIPSAPNG